MKIYFCGSIRGGRELSLTYKKIIEKIRGFGKVLSEHIGNDAYLEQKERALTDHEIHDRDMHWLIESDLLIAEVTVPSLGVGYEIGRAIDMGKPVLCLFNTSSANSLSAMIAGCDKVMMHYYQDIDALYGIIEKFINEYAPRHTS